MKSLTRSLQLCSALCFVVSASGPLSPASAQNPALPPVLHGAAGPPLLAHATRVHLLGLDELYTIALYAAPPFDRAQMLSAEVAKALRIQVAYEPDLRRPIVVDWRRELVPRLRTAVAVTHLRQSFSALRRNDVVLIEYVPGKGTSVRVNTAVVVSGAHHELMLAFLDHWLGQRPVSEEIKSRLQGSP
jgi:hypothetical protein